MIGRNYLARLKAEFKGYSAVSFSKDLLAGITCTAVALPLSLAFGVSSGADAAAGLVCAIIAGVVIGGLSGASYQISGPTGAMAAILTSLCAQYGLQGLFVAGFLSGLLLLLFALFKVGSLVSSIPKPVVTGFTSGIAVVIAHGQLDNVFGTHAKGIGVVAKLSSYFTLGFHPSAIPVMFTALAVLVMVFWPKRLGRIIPGSLCAIIICLILELVFGFECAVVGTIPRTLITSDRLRFSLLADTSLWTFFPPALSIALLGMIESLLCGASAGKMKGEKLDATQELFAQGVGNLIIPFFGGIPATAAIARTSVAIKSGGVTRLVSIIHSIGLLLSMFLFSSLMEQIPLSALAGVLLVTAWRMNEWPAIKVIFSKRIKTSIAMFLTTMVTTVVFDLTIAIVAGVGISVILFVVKERRTLTITVTTEADEKLVTVKGHLFFATQDKLIETVRALKAEGAKRITISLAGVHDIDHSEADELESICLDLEKSGINVSLEGVNPEVRIMLDRLGMVFHKEKI